MGSLFLWSTHSRLLPVFWLAFSFAFSLLLCGAYTCDSPFVGDCATTISSSVAAFSLNLRWFLLTAVINFSVKNDQYFSLWLVLCVCAGLWNIILLKYLKVCPIFWAKRLSLIHVESISVCCEVWVLLNFSTWILNHSAQLISRAALVYCSSSQLRCSCMCGSVSELSGLSYQHHSLNYFCLLRRLETWQRTPSPPFTWVLAATDLCSSIYILQPSCQFCKHPNLGQSLTHCEYSEVFLE